MHIQPIQYYCLVRLHQDLPKHGIVLPENHTMTNPYGEVIRVGPDCKLVATNDKVLFNPENAMRFDTDGDTGSTPVYIIPESCIFAKYVEPMG